ncbi:MULTISPECIES: hypothetical protein [Bacillus]
MKTCTYCGSPVVKEKNNQFYCTFCSMFIRNVQEDGNRIQVSFNEDPSEDDLKKTTPEIMVMSTVDMLFLLKLARKIRSSKYQELSAANAAASNPDTSNEVTLARKDYEYFTKKMYTLENIIMQRIGFIPDRLDKKFFSTYVDNVRNGKKNKEPMRVFHSDTVQWGGYNES